MREEQEHFNRCREVIRENIILYEEKAEKGKKETEELYAAVSSGDTELYNQLIVSRDMQEHNENMLRKNRAAFQKPYFGRVDYKEIKTGQEESLYIGKNGVSKDKTNVIVIDWRAPVSTLYYENELGAGSYDVPDIGTIPVDLKLKRTFDVNDGKLIGYYDNDTAATDELLVKYLSQNKDVVLGDIISTIQKEQNEIIRETPFANIIVQGVAGSGKTTVAMHRISYILYNYEKRFTPSEFCIIGSNDMLLNYITSGLPELDVHHVKQKRMDVFFCEILGREWKKKYQVVETKEAFKSKLNFVKELEKYLADMREKLLPCTPVRDEKLGVILSKESIATTLQENKNVSVHQICKLLNERIKNRIRFLVPEDRHEYCKEKMKEYRGYYKLENAQKNILNIYQSFILEYGKKHAVDISEWLERSKKGKFDVYDVASLALIQKRISEKEVQDQFGQIIVDEAQDFGSMVYYVLSRILVGCYFTIMGDVSQNINYETGMNDWEDLQKEIFEPQRLRFHILAKSYRNTIEISEYAGKILERASFGKYKIQPVIRHGKEVAFCKTEKPEQKTATIIEEIQKRGYDTTAVICRNEKEAEEVRQQLKTLLGVEGEEEEFKKGVMVLPIQLTKGLEFDAVILWNPNEKAYEENEGDAKLLYVAVTRALHELHIVYKSNLSKLFQ